jgi:hypothetical protein
MKMLPAEDGDLLQKDNDLPVESLLEPIGLDMDSSSWGTWDERITLSSIPQGLVAEFSEGGLHKYLYYTFIGPINFKGAIFNVTLCFDEVAAATNRKVVFFNTLGDTWVSGGESDEADAGSDLTYRCTDFSQVATPGQKFKMGLVFTANAGSVTIKSAKLYLPNNCQNLSNVCSVSESQ